MIREKLLYLSSNVSQPFKLQLEIDLKMIEEDNKNYTKIGILALVILVILMVGFDFTFEKKDANKKIKLYSFVDDVTGIQSGTPVLTGGFKIGEVGDLRLEGAMVLIKLSVKHDVKINKSAKFAIATNGLFWRTRN